ncbi:hypothetical protein ACWCYL_19310 [Streptomyces sp. 900105755]
MTTAPVGALGVPPAEGGGRNYATSHDGAAADRQPQSPPSARTPATAAEALGFELP